MINFIVYNPDGVIVRNGSAPAEIAEIQNHGDELIIFGGEYSHEKYVANGVLCDYTESEIHTKNNIPFGWIWKMPGRVVLDVRTLSQAQQQVWIGIKNVRAVKEKSPFTYNNTLYDANPENISGAVQMAMIAKSNSQPFSISWTAYDNSVVTLTGEQMIELGATLGQRIANIYDTARSLRSQIASATTNSQVDAIMWPS